MRVAFVIVAVMVSAVLGAASAGADALGDLRWERRPLLVFAPTNDDPRLVETLSRIQDSQCEFAARDMALGVVVNTGTSTVDGRVIDADESRPLRDRYGIGADGFSVLLIGKDGGEKLRLNQVPELGMVYAAIDGMPMRRGEMGAGSGRC